MNYKSLHKKPICDPWTIVHNDLTNYINKKETNPNLYIINNSYTKMKRNEWIVKIKEIRFDMPESGIYFLCYKREIKYIGQSINLLERIALHISNKGHLKGLLLPIDEIYYEPYPSGQLNVRESYYINEYQPELNTKKKNENNRTNDT